MVSVEVVTNVCDECGQEDGGAGGKVETRRLVVDAVAASEAELCDTDWAKILEALSVFVRRGRPLPVKSVISRKATTAGAYPGMGGWKFADHALIRMGERHINPLEVLPVIERPEITRPGNAADLEIRQRSGLKAVVCPERGVIVTVAHVDESLD